MTIAIIVSIVTLILIIIGLLGCVLPGIPGPPIAYASLIVVSFASGWQSYNTALLIVLAVAALFALIIDNILPVTSAKKAGAGKAGIWGSIIGMVAGILFVPPYGPILGAFLGALLGEMLFNRSNRNPWKAALAILTGTMLGILVKLTITGVIAAFAVMGALRLY